jgi:hypothetical protein
MLLGSAAELEGFVLLGLLQSGRVTRAARTASERKGDMLLHRTAPKWKGCMLLGLLQSGRVTYCRDCSGVAEYLLLGPF